MSNPTAEYYDKYIGNTKVDIYRVLTLYDITHPAHQHAIKKLLRAGNSDETLKEDIEETIDCLERMLEMIEEDGFTEEDVEEPAIEITKSTEKEDYSEKDYEEAKREKWKEMKEEIEDSLAKVLLSDME